MRFLVVVFAFLHRIGSILQNPNVTWTDVLGRRAPPPPPTSGPLIVPVRVSVNVRPLAGRKMPSVLRAAYQGTRRSQVIPIPAAETTLT